MTAPTCGGLVRWFHRRQRTADIETIWPALYARADSLDAARVAWDVFLAQDQQYHWRCPCGEPIRILFRTTIITIAE